MQLDAQRYAINDAYAGALAMRRLLHPDRRAPLPQRVTPLPAAPTQASDGAAGDHVLDSMDGELHAQLFGEPAGERESEDEAAAPRSDAEVHPEVRKTVLQAASELIKRWDESGASQPLELPRFLKVEDRASLHDFCQHRNLSHETLGDEGDRYMRIGRRQGAAVASGDDEAGLGGDIMASLAFDEAWSAGQVKYDPRHWMGNWFLMAQSKSSTLFKYFCVATSDAIFQVWEGDASVAGSREHVKAHLRKRFKQGVGVDMTNAAAAAAENQRVDGLIKRVRRGYWRSRCRFSIPPPRELARRLLSVYYFFREMDDPETGRPFFSSGHEARCLLELSYVAKGDLSDHLTIPLYIELRRTSTGLVISRCLRTSSGLEGYHQHLENAVSKCAKAAGLRFTSAMTNEFDWRWVVRAVRESGLIPKWVRHYNLALIEYLHDAAVQLLGAD